MLQVAQFLQHLEKELQWFRKTCDALFKRRYISHDKFIFQVTIVRIIVYFFIFCTSLHCVNASDKGNFLLYTLLLSKFCFYHC